MKFVVFLHFFTVLNSCSALTHWVVTENGKIESQDNSIYKMNRPYDLMDFIQQEERANNVLELYAEMTRKKREIDSQWNSLNAASELENDGKWNEPECEEAYDIDYYSSLVEYGSETTDLEDLKQNPHDGVNLDCVDFSELDFSMATFPHLQVLIQPWNLSWVKETKIEVPLTPGQIFNGLTRNRTSWYLYNLASLYWRRHGNSQRAIDCIKRSVHFATREYKYVPLFNLGVMLQKAHCSAEAAILLHSSIDHAPLNPNSHLALGNVYTTLGDYNRSVACYENALRLRPNWELAKKGKQAVLCHNKIKQRLTKLQTSLQEIINQLQELTSIQNKLIKNQEDIFKSQQSPLGQTFSQLLTFGGDSCNLRTDNGELVCEPTTKRSIYHPASIDTTSLRLLLSKVESLATKIADDIAWQPFGKKKIKVRNIDDSGEELPKIKKPKKIN